MGWSAIGIARAYPNARVDGYGIDEPSLEHARRDAAEVGVVDRVHFQVADVAQLRGADRIGVYDLAIAWSVCTTCPTRSPCWPRYGR